MDVSHLSGLVLKGFKKVNEFLDPELLESSELTKLENLVLDSQGMKAVKRGGLALFNTNSAGAAIDQIFNAIKSDGNDYLLALSSKSLLKSLAGTGAWSAITTNMTTQAATRLSMTPYAGNYIFTSLDDSPYLLQADMATIGYLTITQPNVSNVTTLNVGPGGYLTPNALYKYVLVYETVTGERSPASREIINLISGELGSTSTAGTNQAMVLSSIPVSSDTRVVSKILYRTKANGNDFFFCARLNKDATTHVDTAADTDLNLSSEGMLEDINLMNKAKYVLAHSERLFFANINETLAPPKMPVIGNTTGGTEDFYGVATTGGTLPSGTYYYKIIFRDSNGYVSTAKTIKAAVTVANPTSNAIKLYNALVPADSLIGREIYRSTDGVSYSLVSLLGNGWTLTDNGYVAMAATLPSATTGTESHKCLVRFSDITKPANLIQNNWIQIFPDDGDEITGIVDDLDGLLIFKRSSIYKLYTTGSGGYKVERLVENIGCDEPMSLQKIGDKIYFMNNKQVYRLGDPVALSKDRINTFNSITAVHSSVYLSGLGWYVLLVTISSTKTILAFDEKVGCWYKFTSDNVAANCLAEKKLGTTKGTFLIGNTSNFLNKYDTSNKRDTADGTNPASSILIDLKTKTFTFPDSTNLARPRLLQFDCKKTNPILSESPTTTHTITREEDGATFIYADGTNAVGMILTAIVHTKGSGYVKGDVLAIATGTDATVRVDSVDASGTIGSITLLTKGYGYTTGAGVATTGGTGTGAKVTITASQTGYKTERTQITGIDSARKLSYEISGRTTEEFNSAEIKYSVLNRGWR